MPVWALPASAAAFWAGLFLCRGVPPAIGGLLVLLVVGCAGLVLVRRRTLPAMSGRLLAGAGVGAARPNSEDARSRILRAAGFPAPERPPPMHDPIRRMAGLVLALLLAGTGWGALHLARRAIGPIDGRYVTFRGTATSDLRRYDWGWAVEAGLESITLDGRTWPVELRAWLSGNADAPAVRAGEQMAGEGSIESLGDGEFARYLSGRGLEVGLRVSGLRVDAGSESLPLAAANAVRDAFREGLERTLPERGAGLLLGLAIGDTSSLAPEVEEDFRATGLGHLLAVSGSNVAIFLAPVLMFASRFRTRPRMRMMIGLLAVVFFALLTRWEPSVLRASVMAAIALAGVASGRPRSTGPVLAAAVLVLLIADPHLSSSLGFQLSVAATVGLAGLASPIASRFRALPKPIALALAATLAAQLTVTPLLLLTFGVVPTVTLLANMLAFPAVSPALLLGVIAAALGLVWPSAGEAFGHVAAVLLDYLIGVADRTARFPLPSVTAEGPAAPILFAGLVGLVAWRIRRGRRPVVTAIALVLIAATAGAVPTPRERSLTATFIDVGQGDAALVRSPDGATILIDAGPDEQQVATELARLGVKRIDLAVATHAHADHVAGFPAVLARYPVSLFLDPGCGGDSPYYRRLLDALEDEEVRLDRPRDGDSYAVGDLSIEVLGPDECSPTDEPNDDSIVLRVSLGDDAVLFPGDAEVPSQQDMLADLDPVEADVLKVPHHGGDTSDPQFLVATHASVAVVSTGPNTYGHPTPEVLEVLRAAGMLVYRTDRYGDVTVRFTPDGSVVVGSGA